MVAPPSVSLSPPEPLSVSQYEGHTPLLDTGDVNQPRMGVRESDIRGGSCPPAPPANLATTWSPFCKTEPTRVLQEATWRGDNTSRGATSRGWDPEINVGCWSGKAWPLAGGQVQKAAPREAVARPLPPRTRGRPVATPGKCAPSLRQGQLEGSLDLHPLPQRHRALGWQREWPRTLVPRGKWALTVEGGGPCLVDVRLP